LADLLYLIDYFYLPEARRRVVEEDSRRYSYIVRARQNLEGFDAMGLSTPAVHQNIETTLDIMREVIVAEIENPTNESVMWMGIDVNIETARNHATLGGGLYGGGDGGISMVVSHDDYPGSSDFVGLPRGPLAFGPEIS
jgi:hypothetical protein